MRHIPATMATQHPDNANAPFWNDEPMIMAFQEINESIDAFSYLNIDEYMWDWEGKHADASVIDKLLTNYYAYFSENNLGRDKFLTFRIPNIWEEKGYSLLQAMTTILSSEDFARDLDFEKRPLFEVILPMTTSANQLMHMHDLFYKFARFKSANFTADRKANTDMIELIPLVESAESQRNIYKIIEQYIDKFQKKYNKKPEYIRPFIACSDAALTSGFIATRISNKLAIQEIYRLEKATNVKMYPIAGSGSLPFRGGLTPENVEKFVNEFAGLRTASIQSAFRYDYPIEEVKTAVNYLNENLSKQKIKQISSSEKSILNRIAEKSSKIYISSLKDLINEMQPIFDSFPKRRERRQHIGLTAYKRSLGSRSLPRAITFTGSFYSIGVPPEFIASGRTLVNLSSDELKTLLKVLPNLKDDFIHAGSYLNKYNLEKLTAQNSGWGEIKKDIEKLEKILNVKFKQTTKNAKKHAALTSLALVQKDNSEELQKLITESGKLRRSLG